MAVSIRYAPEVRLHPNDDNHPSSVSWYLDRVRMRRHRTNWPDAQLLNRGEVNVHSLISQSSGGEHSGQGRKRTQFFLEIEGSSETKAQVCRGDLGSAECYVHIRPAPIPQEGYDIQYWFFYPYNAFGPGHEGDWEHCTARVNHAGELQKYFYASHARESQWVQAAQVATNGSGHPIVYSADESHACYPNAGKHGRGFLPDDETSDGGDECHTWSALRVIGSFDNPEPQQEWVKYTGHWGEIGAIIASDVLVTSGPYGPAFQAWWDNDDRGNGDPGSEKPSSSTSNPSQPGVGQNETTTPKPSSTGTHTVHPRRNE